MKIKKNIYKKIALLLSLGLMCVWFIMGAGTSLAWFTDTSDEVRNIIHKADFDLKVSYKVGNSYKEITQEEAILNDQALYEPGYTEIVRLKIENNGDTPFYFKIGTTIQSYSPATNVYGQEFVLQDYVKFGVVMNSDEGELEKLIETRDLARTYAKDLINQYASDSQTYLNAGEAMYAVLVIYMPKEVGNSANYKEPPEPLINLGIAVRADQLAD